MASTRELRPLEDPEPHDDWPSVTVEHPRGLLWRVRVHPHVPREDYPTIEAMLRTHARAHVHALEEGDDDG